MDTNAPLSVSTGTNKTQQQRKEVQKQFAKTRVASLACTFEKL